MLLNVLPCRGSLHPATKTYLAPNVRFPGEKEKVRKIKNNNRNNERALHHTEQVAAQGGGLVKTRGRGERGPEAPWRGASVPFPGS